MDSFGFDWLVVFCREEEGNDFFSFDWEKEFTSERKLKLKNGHECHLIVNISELFD